MNSHQSLRVLGVSLEIQHIAGPPHNRLPVCVFLHEGLGSVALWKEWPQQVCGMLGCTGLVYSRQGYGQSACVPHVRAETTMTPQGLRQGRLQPDYLHQEALEVLPALLQLCGIQQPLLIGHSDGASIALINASQRPVAACVVLAPHVMVESIALQAIGQARDNYAALKPRLSAFHKDVDCAFWQWNDVWLSQGFRSFDIRPLLHGIQAPLLAIQGHDDPYGTMAQIDDIAQHVPQAQLLKLPDCGHSPHRDQPSAVLEALKYFSKSLGDNQRH